MAHYRWFGPTWDPFREFERIQDEVNRIMGAVEKTVGLRSVPRPCPAINVSEQPEGVVVTAEVPGVDPKDVDLRITQDLLTLKVNRKEPELKNGQYHRQERLFGEFTRTVSFPEKVDPDSAEASYKKGLLRVKMAKAKEVRPRQITISGD